HVRRTRVERQVQLPLDGGGQPVPVRVVQVDVEGREPAQYGGADPPGGDRPDVHALDVVRACDAVGDVPAAVEHDLVGGQVVAHLRKDHHHHVLGDADAVAVGHFGDGDAVLDGGVEVDVVRADSGGDGELQLRRPRDPFRGQVGGPERLRDHDLGVRQLPVELRPVAVLIGPHDELVSLRLQELPQPQ